MSHRISALLLAVGLLLAPGLPALAMDSCSPCCPKPVASPCATDGVPCASLAAATCCDVVPTLPAAQLQASTDLPNLHPTSAIARGAEAAPRFPLSRQIADPLALRRPPARLSVVLLI